MNDIKKVTFFMEECRRMGIKVLGPDVNESAYKFTVNKNGEIRFGLGALKGVGEGAVEAIVDNRKEEGEYESIFDFSKRVDHKAANKKTFESLALAGGFDSFESVHRAQYFYEENGDGNFLDKAIRYGITYQDQQNSSQVSLFGGESSVEIPEPKIPNCEKWGRMEKLSKEKDVVGIYLSGHPLDDYRFEIKHFCNARIKDLADLEKAKGKGEMCFAGIVTEALHRTSKNGKPYGTLTLEGYEENHRFMLFSDDYIKFKSFLTQGWFLFVKGKVQTRAWNDELEFKIQNIELLSDVKDKMSQKVLVKVNYQDIDEDLIQLIEGFNQNKKGKCLLELNLVDRANKNVIEMRSRTFRLKLNKELIENLENNPKLEYQVK